jgi:adenosylhomocysteine nucleosidase
MNLDFPDPLIVMALRDESGGWLERSSIPVLYTGVGKINAAHHLTLKLATYSHAGRPFPFVVNFGTAGSNSFKVGTLVACRAFCQRDMDVTGLGFEMGATPFDSTPHRIEFPQAFAEMSQGICGTGDSFAVTTTSDQFNVVDMEAYALAKVCWLLGTKFASLKYISDGADSNAGASWKTHLDHAGAEFLDVYLKTRWASPPWP